MTPDESIRQINLNYNLHLDEETNKLTFTMPGIKKEWDYTGASEDNTIVNAKAFKLNDIPIIVSVKKSTYIVARYTGESGKPEDFNLVTIDADISQLVQDEIQRRESEYEQIYMFGPNFRSSSYGQLSFKDDHTFSWNNKPSCAWSNFFFSKKHRNCPDKILPYPFAGSGL
ncbi:MAG: hypothetical protein L6V86_09405 [Treponema sp.]|nr:MAG: hypothetical protein L6V86_09405 [Treponema sp.]